MKRTLTLAAMAVGGLVLLPGCAKGPAEAPAEPTAGPAAPPAPAPAAVEPPAPRAAEPPAPPEPPAFFGPDVRAGSVVFVVDRSRSMRDAFDQVKWELVRAVEAMGRGQRFQVLFFSSGEPLAVPRGRLLDATRENKDRTREFLDAVLPASGTDPSAAIRRAFALRPEVLYILTDGEFEPAVVDLVKELNADGRVRVHTIALLYREGEAALKQIADQNGGTYRFVRQRDLSDINLPR